MGLGERYANLSQLQKILLWVASFFLVVALVLGLVSLLSPKPQPGVVVNNDPVTIRWRKLFYTQNDLNDILSGFKELYPNVTVELETLGVQDLDNYYSRLVVDFSQNNPPDIFSINSADLPALSQYMSPISYYAGQNLLDYTNSFTNLVVRNTMVLNNVYAITSYVDNIQMYYNVDILNQEKIALPAKTWDELVTHVKKITRRNTVGDFLQSGISLGTANNVTRVKEILPILVMQRGGVIYDQQNKVVGLGQPKGVNFSSSNLARQTPNSFVLDQENSQDNPTLDAVRFYTEFANPLSSFYSWNRQSPNSEDAFVDGKVGYIFHYSYFQDVLKSRNPNLKFEVAPLPQFNQSNKKTFGNFFMDGMGRHLSDSTKLANDPDLANKRSAAEALLVYLASTDAQRSFNAKTLTPPARKDIIEELSNQTSNQFVEVFSQGSLYADDYYRPRTNTGDIWINMLEDMQTKSIPMNQAVSNLVNEYQRIIGLGPDIQIVGF